MRTTHCSVQFYVCIYTHIYKRVHTEAFRLIIYLVRIKEKASMLWSGNNEAPIIAAVKSEQVIAGTTN